MQRHGSYHSSMFFTLSIVNSFSPQQLSVKSKIFSWQRCTCISYSPAYSSSSFPPYTHSPSSQIFTLANWQSMCEPMYFLQQAGLFCQTQKQPRVLEGTIRRSLEKKCFLWRSLWVMQRKVGQTRQMTSLEKSRHSQKANFVTRSDSAQFLTRRPVFLISTTRQAWLGLSFLSSAVSSCCSGIISKVTMCLRLMAASMRMRQDRKSLLRLQACAGAPVSARKRSHIPQLCTLAKSRQVPQVFAIAFSTSAGQIQTEPLTSLLFMKSRYFWLIATFIGTKSSTITYRQTPSLQIFTEYIPFSLAYCSPNS